MTTGLAFPDGFLWGAATSAQQIEGGRHAGERGDSIWDAFAARPGAIEDGTTPDITCDHYHRWREDLDLMAGLGLNAYRFSIAWPRIQPEGRGPALAAGLDFYDALVDGLLERGLRPFPTLYHWDLPLALQQKGGWPARETAAAFAEYAGLVVRRLGDRVGAWTTINEPWCAAVLGHEEGCHAPGLKDPLAGMRAAHHLLLGHGLAAAAIRAEAPRAEVGIVQIHCPSHPATSSEDDRDAARWFDGFFNRWYLDPVFRGAYPADAVADRVARGQLPGSDLTFVHEGDLETIAAPLDFLGINYYSRNVMRAGADGSPEAVPQAPPEQLTDMGWEVYPEGLRESLLRVHRDYAPPAIYVTEFGAAFDDPLGAGGRIADSRRVDYLRRHLEAAHAALADGVPLRGCFVWSLLDNYEWAHGFTKRFGLYAVDPATRRRTPKDSAYWYREVTRTNAVPARAVTRTGGETP